MPERKPMSNPHEPSPDTDPEIEELLGILPSAQQEEIRRAIEYAHHYVPAGDWEKIRKVLIQDLKLRHAITRLKERAAEAHESFEKLDRVVGELKSIQERKDSLSGK